MYLIMLTDKATVKINVFKIQNGPYNSGIPPPISKKVPEKGLKELTTLAITNSVVTSKYSL